MSWDRDEHYYTPDQLKWAKVERTVWLVGRIVIQAAFILAIVNIADWCDIEKESSLLVTVGILLLLKEKSK